MAPPLARPKKEIGFMRVIFLDFDGVLVTLRSLQARKPHHKNPATEDEWIKHKADRKAVEALNYLLEQSGAKIVVSSSWRRTKEPLKKMRKVLNLWGVAGEVLDVTPYSATEKKIINDDGKEVSLFLGRERGHEIQAWLDAWNRACRTHIESFVILDDEADMVHLGDRLVQSDFEQGLTQDLAQKAIALLSLVVAAASDEKG
jgi:hypothetical protein